MSALVLVVAAALAGAVNALAGGGTLITYPSLLAFGVAPVAANATSTVALVPGALSAWWGFRGRTRGDVGELLWMALPSVVGGAIGALLAMWVGNRTFARVVPWLIFGATALFLAQRPIKRWLDGAIGGDRRGRRRALQVGLQLGIAVYGGFFGAAMGIVMLAMLGLVGYDDLGRMNGLKSFAAVCINGIAAVAFVVGRQVNLPLALLMVSGSVAGGYAAARISHRLDARWVRGLVVCVGFGMGVYTLCRR